MKQILLDGQPFTYGDSLEVVAAMGIDLERLSFAPEEPAAMATRLKETTKHWMDERARERNYADVLTLCSYASSTVPSFKAEGQAGVEWRDRCRLMVERLIEESRSGIRTAPTDEELVALMPSMEWPAAASAAA